MDVFDDVKAAGREVRPEVEKAGLLVGWLVAAVVDDDVERAGFRDDSVKRGRVGLVADEDAEPLALEATALPVVAGRRCARGGNNRATTSSSRRA